MQVPAFQCRDTHSLHYRGGRSGLTDPVIAGLILTAPTLIGALYLPLHSDTIEFLPSVWEGGCIFAIALRYYREFT